MNIKSLIGKFGSGARSTNCLRVVVQPYALYFSPLEGVELPKRVSIESGDWQKILVETLTKANANDLTIDVVLNSNLYQTYQIDKPNVPDEELGQTLPFLLKDLISEKITDIIADATALPNSNKLQVYVVPKALVFGLVQRLEKAKLSLGHVLVEDDVWGLAATDAERFVLLQRSKNSQYKVSAFIDNRCVFQRTIRGVTAPLVGVASSGLQLDGIALELQRSVDYLSSQLRGATLHHMKVCCDEENNDDLARELDDRLSVKVSRLTDLPLESGELLTQYVADICDSGINLYPAHLRPKVERFTLNTVAAVCALIAVALLGSYGCFTWQHVDLNAELSSQRSQEEQLKQQVKQLNQKLAKHKPSAQKVAAVERLKEEIRAKQDSLLAVSRFDDEQNVGYSGVMKGLAKLGRNDISLNYIKMSSDVLDLKGLAREPQSIPNWVNQFKNELNLVGRSFEKLKIGRNEQDVLTFELHTKEDKK